MIEIVQRGAFLGGKKAKPARKYVTKSKSGHYTATVRAPGQPWLFKQGKLSSAYEANRLADEFLATLVNPS